jgi:hypothetical protein
VLGGISKDVGRKEQSLCNNFNTVVGRGERSAEIVRVAGEKVGSKIKRERRGEMNLGVGANGDGERVCVLQCSTTTTTVQ